MSRARTPSENNPTQPLSKEAKGLVEQENPPETDESRDSKFTEEATKTSRKMGIESLNRLKSCVEKFKKIHDEVNAGETQVLKRLKQDKSKIEENLEKHIKRLDEHIRGIKNEQNGIKPPENPLEKIEGVNIFYSEDGNVDVEINIDVFEGYEELNIEDDNVSGVLPSIQLDGEKVLDISADLSEKKNVSANVGKAGGFKEMVLYQERGEEQEYAVLYSEVGEDIEEVEVMLHELDIQKRLSDIEGVPEVYKVLGVDEQGREIELSDSDLVAGNKKMNKIEQVAVVTEVPERKDSEEVLSNIFDALAENYPNDIESITDLIENDEFQENLNYMVDNYKSLFKTLQEIHNEGIVHNDIKSENEVGDFIIDYGSADEEGSKRLGDTEFDPTLIFTPAYAEPGKFSRENENVDLYDNCFKYSSEGLMKESDTRNMALDTVRDLVCKPFDIEEWPPAALTEETELAYISANELKPTGYDFSNVEDAQDFMNGFLNQELDMPPSVLAALYSSTDTEDVKSTRPEAMQLVEGYDYDQESDSSEDVSDKYESFFDWYEDYSNNPKMIKKMQVVMKVFSNKDRFEEIMMNKNERREFISEVRSIGEDRIEESGEVNHYQDAGRQVMEFARKNK